jgi:hypothetical protein
MPAARTASSLPRRQLNDQQKTCAREKLYGLLARLPDRDRHVVEQRLGLVDGYSRSVKEVSRQFKTTPDRIRIIQDRAFKTIAAALGVSATADVIEALLEPSLEPRVESLSEVIERVTQLTPELIAYLQAHTRDLEKLPWDVFEHLIAEFLASQGFSHVALVGRSSTTAADIFAAYYVPALAQPIRLFVEVKRWRDRVGIEVIDRVYGAMLLEQPTHGWHAAMIVSLSGHSTFRRLSKHQIAKRGVELKSRDDLLSWLHGYRQHSSGLWLPSPARSIDEALRNQLHEPRND